MARQKVSVTLSPERVDRARAVTGRTNLSELLDDALVERELERRWLGAQDAVATGDQDLPGEVGVDLPDVPWVCRSYRFAVGC